LCIRFILTFPFFLVETPESDFTILLQTIDQDQNRKGKNKENKEESKTTTKKEKGKEIFKMLMTINYM